MTEKVALLQSGPGITNWGKSFRKVQQVINYKVGQSLLQNVVGLLSRTTLLQSGTTITEKASTSL